MQIRDTRNGSWYWVNTAVNACCHISSTDKVVYGALCTFAGCIEIHPSYPEISKRSAVSERACKNSIQTLIKVGYLLVEKGGGKGNANVYILLKVPKGCTACTVSKGCTDCNDTVQNPSSKGAQFALQVDKELDKELDTEQSSETTGLIINLFKEINPSYKNLFKRKTQHESAKRLLEREGYEKLVKIIKFIGSRRIDKFCPQISSPYQLEEKWSALEKYALGLKAEINKFKVAF